MQMWAIHNTIWKWMEEGKRDSLRTDGGSTKNHLSWTEEDI